MLSVLNLEVVEPTLCVCTVTEGNLQRHWLNSEVKWTSYSYAPQSGRAKAKNYLIISLVLEGIQDSNASITYWNSTLVSCKTRI